MRRAGCCQSARVCCSQLRVQNNGHLLSSNKSIQQQPSVYSVASMTIRGAQTQNGNATSTPSTAAAKQNTSKLRPLVPQTTSVVVLTNKNAPPAPVVQSLLQKHLPAGTYLLGIGEDLDAFVHLTDEQWASVDIVLKWGGNTPIGQDVWQKLTGLKWIHSVAAGMERLLSPELVASDVIVTNARGVTRQSLAEFAFTAMHYFANNIPRLLQSKSARTWDVFEMQELRGATVGLVGYGGIGRRVAELARAYGMKVIALRRNTQLSHDELKQGLLEAVYGPHELHTLLSQSDYVVISTPHTPDTDKIIDADAVAALKAESVVINVGRGKCIDEAALVQALQAGRIKGAGLDVTEIEPLPADSPLWELSNVLLSYHTAARTRRFAEDTAELFLENLKRYVTGEDLVNLVDKNQLY